MTKYGADDKSMGIEKLSMNRKDDGEGSSKSVSDPGLSTPKKKTCSPRRITYPMTPPAKRGYRAESSRRSIFEYSGLSTPKKCCSMDQINYPMTPPTKPVRGGFRVPTISPAPIDRAYRRRIISMSSSPCSSRSSSPFSSPSKEPPSRKIRHYHKSPKERRSKSDSTILFPKDLNLPSKKHLYSDRHIPSRAASLLGDGALLDTCEEKKNNDNSPAGANDTYSLLLRNTMLGPCGAIRNSINDHRTPSKTSGSMDQNGSPHPRTLRFKSPRRQSRLESPFSLSPVGVDNQRLFSSPRKAPRKIPKSPFKVLDAPSLKDDFYLNLVDWSYENVLAVGLASCVYLWSACTSKVTKLCDLGERDSVTSVTWSQRGTQLAVGTRTGEVQIWDTAKCKLINTMKGHVARVGTLAWSSHLLASGSRDRMIYLRDPRSSKDWETKLMQGHKQEVCGLKWSFDDQQLASGGNDNKLLIWSARGSHIPIIRCGDHTAAVKAIAWSPHQNGLLASGGGTADRCIRFRNTLTDTALNTIDTGSQVCNLIWSKNVNEIVSTHGYSLNQIIVWKYPSMTPLATLTGHTFRVLYLAISPDGQTIVTGAGDETLRFWNVFPISKSKGTSRLNSKLFFLSSSDIR